MARVAVILAAAGKSQRFRDQHYKKPFAPLANKAVWLHSAEKFLNRQDVKQVLLVISPDDRDDFTAKFGANIAILGVDLVDGGDERADSVQAALSRVDESIDLVAIHDAARPCLVDAWIDKVFAAAESDGAAILANRVTGTLKRSTDGKTIGETVSREQLWEAQTPQVFRKDLLVDSYAKRRSACTDDAQVVEANGHAVTLVETPRMNIKITTRDDLRWAEQTMKALPKSKLGGAPHPFADGDLWR